MKLFREQRVRSDARGLCDRSLQWFRAWAAGRGLSSVLLSFGMEKSTGGGTSYEFLYKSE